MADPTQAHDKPSPSKVTISSPGISVAVESHAPLDVVAAKAQELHREAGERSGSLPSGFGGAV
ncbi:hypothetical protein ACGF7U_31325 [Micromonospora sp. NPDC047670]|uniref:hypothetical protein n=1 Tax=Micromonospora sp. NPDC047670 TaxID=3364252 RepID=UPI00371F28CA